MGQGENNEVDHRWKPIKEKAQEFGTWLAEWVLFISVDVSQKYSAFEIKYETVDHAQNSLYKFDNGKRVINDRNTKSQVELSMMGLVK